MTVMTGATECYVYMVLPGATEFTTVGRFAIDSERDPLPQGHFVYCRSYLDNPDAVPIDPICLNKLSDRIYRTTKHNGLFSSLLDSKPDRWARRAITRMVRKKSLDKPGEIDLLLLAPDDRAGALGFGCSPVPPAPNQKFKSFNELAEISSIIDAIDAREGFPQVLSAEEFEALNAILTSLGGKRPKAIVEDAEGLWISKFNRKHDDWNHARIEHAILELASACGITAVRSRVVTVAGKDVLLVKRFDREKTARGYLRSRMISGQTVLRAEGTVMRPQRWSYALLAEEIRRFGAQPDADSTELFRRMVFNALIFKDDDGPSNHAMISKRAGWKLSPAYDLIPSLKPIGLKRYEHAMSCGIFGRIASVRNMLTECGRFLLGEEEATTIINSMEEFVNKNWHKFARCAGVTESDCRKISGIIASSGFRHISK